MEEPLTPEPQELPAPAKKKKKKRAATLGNGCSPSTSILAIPPLLCHHGHVTLGLPSELESEVGGANGTMDGEGAAASRKTRRKR